MEVEMLAGIDIEKIVDVYVVPWSVNIALAIVVFIVGRLIAKVLVKVLEGLLVRAKVDTMVRHCFFLSLLPRWICWASTLPH
jgi:small conductance mechanosensitive channel